MSVYVFGYITTIMEDMYEKFQFSYYPKEILKVLLLMKSSVGWRIFLLSFQTPLFSGRYWEKKRFKFIHLHYCTCTVFIEKKNLCKSGPMQFKPVLFKGQLYLFVLSVFLCCFLSWPGISPPLKCYYSALLLSTYPLNFLTSLPSHLYV